MEIIAVGFADCPARILKPNPVNQPQHRAMLNKILSNYGEVNPEQAFGDRSDYPDAEDEGIILQFLRILF